MKPEEIKVIADTIWVLVTAFLVFWMNAGFALVESGFCRAKNCVNILAKNFIVFAATSLIYWAVGFGLHFGNGNAFFGQQGFFLDPRMERLIKPGPEGWFNALDWTSVPLWAKFFFELVFAGTAATIVSGAVAERIKFHSFLIFSFVMGALLYPITGHWIWGGGFLGSSGMYDFAGSTVVHSVGGWAALTGALMLGPRIGKYRPDGKITPIPGHNITSATLGALILWLGWFGFNPGSTMSADMKAIGHIAVTTNLACSAGILSATLWSWLRLGKPDMSMIINGALAGLVAITAPCAFVSPVSSIIIGAVAGVLVVESVLFFDRIKVDDPVGAISVHLVNGIWGTLSVGIFAQETIWKDYLGWSAGPRTGFLMPGGSFEQFRIQFIGVFWVGVYTFFASLLVWGLIKALVGLRVSAEEEIQGLDIGEHGMEAYPGDPLATTEALRQAGWERIVPSLLPEPIQRRSSLQEALSREESPLSRTIAQESPSSERLQTASVGVLSEPSRGFKVIVENANRDALRRRWEMLCRGTTSDTPPEFAEVFNNLTAFEDNTFVFHRGDPERMRRCVERILEGYAGIGATTRIERLSE